MEHTPGHFWVNGLNLLAGHAAQQGKRPEKGIRYLTPWLRLLPPFLYAYLLCDMALYAAQALRPEEAMHLIQRAQRTMQDASIQNSSVFWYYDWYWRMTNARVLLSLGKPVEALEWLPTADLTGDGRVVSLFLWAETFLAAGEKGTAACFLSEAQNHLSKMPLPARQRRFEQLTRQI